MTSVTLTNQLDFVTDADLQSELRLRRPKWVYRTVPKALVPELVEAGWDSFRENRTSVRIRRPKSHDQLLEDEVWAFLARVGFPQLNRGRHFRVPITREPNAPTKQLDVLAADDETALIVECKYASKVGPKSMGKDLNESNGIRAAVLTALRNQFGLKQKVGWVYATRGIVWSDADRARAREYGITVLTDNEIDYYLRLADLIGPAARHQLQAEVFGDKRVDGLNRQVLAVRGEIAGRRFYQFTIDPERLLKIAFISHRQRLDADSVSAYQRMLKRNRLASIRSYIDEGGVFPTNVVVNFRKKCRFDPSGAKSAGGVALGTLYLPPTYKSAWVIDGQHRLYGFAGSARAGSTQLPVLAFEELPPDEEARMFVDINNKQVRVQRSLLVELQAELYWGSEDPQERFHALVSRLVAVLGRDIGSPLRGRMVEEGDVQSSTKPITTTGLYEAIRKTPLVGSFRRNVFVPGPLYAGDDSTALRRSTDILSRYFGVFASQLPEHWDLGNGEGGFLCTNNGLTALLTVLDELVGHLESTGVKAWQSTPDELVAALAPFLDPVVALFRSAGLADIRGYRRQVGNLGQRRVAFAMMEAINSARPSFDPPGLDEYRKSHDQTGTNRARVLIPELQLMIQDATLRILKAEFGSEESGWWRMGVPATVRKAVAVLRESSAELGSNEQYFQLLDYRSIAEANWLLFAPFFAYGEGKSKDRLLSWFSKLNPIRNRIAHPEQGPVSEEELEFIEELIVHFESLKLRLPTLDV